MPNKVASECVCFTRSESVWLAGLGGTEKDDPKQVQM